VREPVLNGWSKNAVGQSKPADGISIAPRRGFAREVLLTAKGWEPRLTLDGLIRVPVPFGTKVGDCLTTWSDWLMTPLNWFVYASMYLCICVSM
jgi:hypothetical protein